MFVFYQQRVILTFLQNGSDPLITQALTGVRVLSNAIHDMSFESTYSNLQDE